VKSEERMTNKLLKPLLLTSAIVLWSLPALSGLIVGNVLVNMICGDNADMKSFLAEADATLMGHGVANAGYAIAIWKLDDGQFVVINAEKGNAGQACITNIGRAWENISPNPKGQEI